MSDEVQYRLNVYTPTGTLKSNVKSAVYRLAALEHGDILRSLGSQRWMTLDDVCETVWRYEKKMLHPSNRSRVSISNALEELVEKNFVAKR